MSALTRYFFDPVYFPDSNWDVVRWWEARRPVYNAAVGGAGLVTLTVLGVLGALPVAPVTLALVGAYAAMANVCYSFGALADVTARRSGGAWYAVVGPALFRYGFVFSIGLTLFPVVLALLAMTVGFVASRV